MRLSIIFTILLLITFASCGVPSIVCRTYPALSFTQGITAPELLPVDVTGDGLKDYIAVFGGTTLATYGFNAKGDLKVVSTIAIDGTALGYNGIAILDFNDGKYHVVLGNNGTTAPIYTYTDFSKTPVAAGSLQCEVRCRSPIILSTDLTSSPATVQLALYNSLDVIQQVSTIDSSLTQSNTVKIQLNFAPNTFPVSIGDTDGNGLANIVQIVDKKIYNYELDQSAGEYTLLKTVKYPYSDAALTLLKGDLDGDGDIDLLSGITTNTSFYVYTLLKADGSLQENINYDLGLYRAVILLTNSSPRRLLYASNTDGSAQMLQEFCSRERISPHRVQVHQGTFGSITSDEGKVKVTDALNINDDDNLSAELTPGSKRFISYLFFSFPENTGTVYSGSLLLRFAAPKRSVNIWTFSYQNSEGKWVRLLKNSVSQDSDYITKMVAFTPSGSTGTISDYSNYLSPKGDFKLRIRSSTAKESLKLDLVRLVWHF